MIEDQQRKLPFLQGHISRRLIFYILLFSSLITLILTTIQLFLDYRHGIDLIEDSINQIEVSYLNGIKNSLWVSDTELLQIQLNGMLKLNDMEYIDITDDNGVVIKVGKLGESQQISREFPLSYTYENGSISLGKLRVVYTLQNLYASLLDKMIVIAVSQSIKTFLVSGFILFIFYMLVGRYLNALANYTKTLNLSSLNAPFVLRNKKNDNEKDEFNIVTKAINEMRTNLSESYLRLQKEIKERILIEKALKENSAFNETILSISPDIIYIYDLVKKGNVYSNEGIKRILGYSVKEIQNMGDTLVQALMHPDDFLNYLNHTVPLYTSARDGELIEHEYRMKHKNENWLWLYSKELIFSRQEDGKPNRIFGMISDITERKLADEQIKASLAEKETLLQEIHHRVKNNMQVISSLLDLQTNGIENKQVRSALRESKSRVHAMSAVHETLYKSDKLSAINLQSYISKIIPEIFNTYLIAPGRIVLNKEVEEVPISIKQAPPLGLIINELISNSLKYAFPDDRKGEVTISIKKIDKELELTVIDDGVGIPEGMDWRNANSLGLKLVRSLSEDQLDGSVEMESNSSGTRFTIKFNIEA